MGLGFPARGSKEARKAQIFVQGCKANVQNPKLQHGCSESEIKDPVEIAHAPRA